MGHGLIQLPISVMERITKCQESWLVAVQVSFWNFNFAVRKFCFHSYCPLLLLLNFVVSCVPLLSKYAPLSSHIW